MRTYAWVSQYTEGRCISFRSKLKNAYCLKWLFTQKCYFFVGLPPSVQYFFVKWTLFVPFLHIFDRFCGFLIQRGTNCAIFNINNWRLERLKIHVIFQKKSLVLKIPRRVWSLHRLHHQMVSLTLCFRQKKGELIGVSGTSYWFNRCTSMYLSKIYWNCKFQLWRKSGAFKL